MSPSIKQPRHTAQHSPTSNAEAKNAWSSNSTHLYAFMACCLIRLSDNYVFKFTEKSIQCRCNRHKSFCSEKLHLPQDNTMNKNKQFLEKLFKVSPGILGISRNPQVYNRVRKIPTLFSTHSQINPFHILPSYLLKINFNIVLRSTPRCYK